VLEGRVAEKKAITTTTATNAGGGATAAPTAAPAVAADASSSGRAWEHLDTQRNVVFTARHEALTFPIKVEDVPAAAPAAGGTGTAGGGTTTPGMPKYNQFRFRFVEVQDSAFQLGGTYGEVITETVDPATGQKVRNVTFALLPPSPEARAKLQLAEITLLTEDDVAPYKRVPEAPKEGTSAQAFDAELYSHLIEGMPGTSGDDKVVLFERANPGGKGGETSGDTAAVAAGVSVAVLAAVAVAALVMRRRGTSLSGFGGGFRSKLGSFRMPFGGGGGSGSAGHGVEMRNAPVPLSHQASMGNFAGANPASMGQGSAVPHFVGSNPMSKPKPLNRQGTFTKARPPPPPSTAIEEFAPMPPGWFENTDPSSGKTYYYTETGDVTWIRPTMSIV
jgi:hypothetical protein